MLGLTKFGNFHNSDNRIGVELETTLVNEDYQKPVEQDVNVAFKNNLDYVIGELNKALIALKDNKKAREKFNTQLVSYEICDNLFNDPEYQIKVSTLDYIKFFMKDKLAATKLIFHYSANNFKETLKEKYDKYLNSDNEDRGLEEILGLIEYTSNLKKQREQDKRDKKHRRKMEAYFKKLKDSPSSTEPNDGEMWVDFSESDHDKFEKESEDYIKVINLMRKEINDFLKESETFRKSSTSKTFKKSSGVFLESYLGPIGNFMIGGMIGDAYANKLLPTYVELSKEFSSDEKEKITYDRSDAIEMITNPVKTVAEVKDELIKRYKKIKPFLEKNNLNVVFASRLPDAKPAGWKEILKKGEPQNVFGMHVHFGRANDEFEAAYVYEAFRRVTPEIMALTANSGVSSGEVVEAMSERQNLYRNLIPESLDVKPNMNFLEKVKLRKELKEIFGQHAKYESVDQYNLQSSLEELMKSKGVDLKLKKRKNFTKGDRNYSSVFMRPELGTVEVRMVDTQTCYEDGSIESHIDENMYAVELIDAIGKAALDAYRNGEEFISGRNDLDGRYERAIQKGLTDKELKEDSAKLLEGVGKYLNPKSREVFETRVKSGISPAMKQKEIFKTLGRDGLYKAITTR